MKHIELVHPSIRHKEAAYEYRQEFFNNGEDTIHGDGGLDNSDNYREWLAAITRNRYKKREGNSTATTYFCVIKNRIIGTIQISHTLNDVMSLYGGHIAYSIRPSERNNGYGTRMLSLALKKCRNMGIYKVLITCNKENVYSAKMIINNGGVLENEVRMGEKGIFQRYWVDNSAESEK